MSKFNTLFTHFRCVSLIRNSCLPGVSATRTTSLACPSPRLRRRSRSPVKTMSCLSCYMPKCSRKREGGRMKGDNTLCERRQPQVSTVWLDTFIFDASNQSTTGKTRRAGRSRVALECQGPGQSHTRFHRLKSCKNTLNNVC